jgi:hypothetical protein
MNLDQEILEKVKLFEQVKNNLGEITKKMGALREEQMAVYNQGLELKGAIDVLMALQQKEREDLAKSATAKLILPEGVKPIIDSGAKVAVEVAPVPQEAVSQESTISTQVPVKPGDFKPTTLEVA